MKAPAFWYRQPPRPYAHILRPASGIWHILGQARKLSTKQVTASVPVICVGNLVAGGAGKTPVVKALARYFHEQGRRPGILLRGYKRKTRGTFLVNPDTHTALDVGDEALLHAAYAPTVVAENRADGARYLTHQTDIDLILMDDGLQNPQLYQNKKLCVIDAAQGFGNGLVIPAGPLRTNLKQGLKECDAIIILGNNIPPDLGTWLRNLAPHAIQICGQMHLEIPEAVTSKTPLYAFCGLGRPEKFFTSLKDAGFTLAGSRAFPDHHFYTKSDLETLKQTAGDAVLATTAKDAVKIAAQDKKNIHIFDISVDWQNTDSLATLLERE